MKPETKFRSYQVVPFVRSLPNTVVFPIQQMAITGDPDFILCIRGLFVALELKDKKGKLGKLQEYKLGKVDECGGVALVASPFNWAKVKKVLTDLATGEVG